jgi:HAD superfamily hydrolase (TIGR01509 family)
MNDSTLNPSLKMKAVIFDHDGTLVRSEGLHQRAWEALISELLPDRASQEAAMRVVLRSVGLTAPEILSNILNSQGLHPSGVELEAYARRKNDVYLSLMGTHLQAYPGVEDGLKWLQQRGIRLAVVSNARGKELRAGLEAVGLTKYFEGIFGRDEVPRPKPYPESFLAAVTKLGLHPADCLVLEDSPTGLEAALRGGIPCAGVLTNFTRPELERPIPGEPDRSPIWIGEDARAFFKWLEASSK